jgi:hypothetical protein
VVKHRTSSYKIEAAGIHGPGRDILLAQLQIRQMHINERQIEIDGYRPVHPERPAGQATRKLSRYRSRLPAFLAPDLTTLSD